MPARQVNFQVLRRFISVYLIFLYPTADLNNDMWQAVAFLVLVNIQFNTGEMIYLGHIGNGKSQVNV